MSAETPEGYRPGVAYLEALSAGALEVWLKAELDGPIHILAGQADDFPVQAILNHYRYLSPIAQDRLAGAVDSLVADWKRDVQRWEQSAAGALLDLVAELPVRAAKSKLISLATSEDFGTVEQPLQIAVLQTVGELSENTDRAFWVAIRAQYPSFAGLSFQVLTTIAPNDAAGQLRNLPDQEEVIGGVARELADYVSSYSREEQPRLLSDIALALSSLSPASAEHIRLSLSRDGFDMPSPKRQKQKQDFDDFIVTRLPTIKRRSSVSRIHAPAT